MAIIALVWILFALSFVILIVSLMMAPDSNAFSGAIVGSSDLDLFKISKERGSKKLLKWLMFGLGLALLVISLVIRALH
ncbi:MULTISPECIES: preprotein translocase subunit SecG [unclassified Mycoplasma]|uniref:preprotein translocase subunit SecG n=1 Tax=unclassified Mycoplasma TaxID=2683645 RepID=UPI000FDDEA91